MERKDKTVAESKLETFHIIMPENMNDSGRLFGGRLMAWIDDAAGIAAIRHCGRAVTTVSLEVQDLAGLEQVIGRISAVPGVTEISRNM